MLVYIDDSGDGGFKFGKGSTSHLVMSACVYASGADVEHAVKLIDECARSRSMTREFKYSERSEETRDIFFEALKPARFHVRAIVIDKSTIYSDTLRTSPQALKSYAIRMLLTKNFGQVQGAKVFIDGQDTRAFDVGDGDYLMRMINRESPNTISSVRHVDSAVSRPIQIADMISGAINRAVRTDQPSSGHHLDTFRNRTYQPRGTLWFFKPRPELVGDPSP